MPLFIFTIFYTHLYYFGLVGLLFHGFGGWYGSNRPMTAFQAVSSSIEAVLNGHYMTIK
jgi:hypothetical protein